MANEGSTKPAYSELERDVANFERCEYELIARAEAAETSLAGVRGLLQRATELLQESVNTTSFFDEGVEKRIKEFLATFPQSSSLVPPGAESADIGKLDGTHECPVCGRDYPHSSEEHETDDLFIAETMKRFSNFAIRIAQGDNNAVFRKFFRRVANAAADKSGKVNRVDEKYEYEGCLCRWVDGCPVHGEPDVKGALAKLKAAMAQKGAETGGEKAATKRDARTDLIESLRHFDSEFRHNKRVLDIAVSCAEKYADRRLAESVQPEKPISLQPMSEETRKFVALAESSLSSPPQKDKNVE